MSLLFRAAESEIIFHPERKKLVPERVGNFKLLGVG
jgi:hypothetical protein